MVVPMGLDDRNTFSVPCRNEYNNKFVFLNDLHIKNARCGNSLYVYVVASLVPSSVRDYRPKKGREKNFEPGAPYVATISIIRFCAQWKSWTLGLLGG